LILVHLMIVLAMIGVVLLQKSEGGGLGIGSAGGFLSGRGAANVVTRPTAALPVVFFPTSLLLSFRARLDCQAPSFIPNTGAPTQQQAPQGEGGGVLDTLRQQEQQQPATPPPGPQVPRSQ